MEILTWLSLQSESVKSSDLLELLFILYVATAILIKKSRYLLAFFFSVLLIECLIFDTVNEYQLYLTYFIVYSYMCSHSVNAKTKMACGIMCLLDLLLAYDALYYGADGLHGER